MQIVTRYKIYKECPKCLSKFGKVYAHTEMRRDYANDVKGTDIPFEKHTIAYTQIQCYSCCSCKHYWEANNGN